MLQFLLDQQLKVSDIWFWNLSSYLVPVILKAYLLQNNISIYEMPQEKSIDIDTKLDLRINEMIIKTK